MADPSYINSQTVDWNKFYSGILPSPAPKQVANTGVTPQQLQAIQAVPANSYQWPANAPVQVPNAPTNSQFADTGNQGRATPDMMGLLPLDRGPAYPTVADYSVPATTAIEGALSAAGVPLPRPRPGYAPTAMDIAAMNQQQGANPGLGGALIGNGIMSPNIPPQQQPSDGSPATVWAGGSGSVTPTPRVSPITQGTDGYTYQDGKVVGLTDWAQRGRQQGLGPQGIYDAANLAGQLKAQIRGQQARAAGQTTTIEKLRAQGMSPSDAYAAANAIDYSGSGYNAVDRLQAKQAQSSSGGPADSLMSNNEGGGTPHPVGTKYPVGTTYPVGIKGWAIAGARRQ